MKATIALCIILVETKCDYDKNHVDPSSIFITICTILKDRKKLDEKCPGFLSFGSSKEAKKQNSSAEEYPLKENNELNGNPKSQQPLKKENTFVVESNTTGQVVTSIGEGSSLMQPSSYHV